MDTWQTNLRQVRQLIHLKLLTNRCLQHALQQMNTFLHQPQSQSQVRELTLDNTFMTFARNYFWSTTN